MISMAQVAKFVDHDVANVRAVVRQASMTASPCVMLNGNL
jgi:hypothetical protein